MVTGVILSPTFGQLWIQLGSIYGMRGINQIEDEMTNLVMTSFNLIKPIVQNGNVILKELRYKLSQCGSITVP